MYSFSTCRLVVLVLATCNAMTFAQEPVRLEEAGHYAILAKTGITTVPTSVITGDIAVSPAADTAMTGFSFFIDQSTQSPTSLQLVHDSYAYAYSNGGAIATVLTAAVVAMRAAYTDAAGRVNDDEARINLGDGSLGGVYGGPVAPLTPGVYTFGSNVLLNNDVHFSGDGVYIIQITGNLKQAANYNVFLENGAQAENIFWQVAGYVEVGAGGHMEGIILSQTLTRFLTGSSLNGRILTQTACILQSATITEQPPAPPARQGRRGLRSV